MLTTFTFHARYFILTLVLLVIEVCIALYVHDDFIRPYAGDFLVVIFLYCLVRSFVNIVATTAAVAVLLFAYCIEILQYFHFISLIHLQHSLLARLILGTSFSWSDLLAYTIGAAVILLVEKLT